MGFLDRFRRKAKTIAEPLPERAPGGEGRRADSTAQILAAMQGGAAPGGVVVTSESALTFSAVLGCVRVLSEGVAALPLITYERIGRGKERSIIHSLYSVLHDSPNDEMTSFQWRETSMAHCTLWGNCYSEIIADGAGRVRELWPLLPQQMTPKRTESGLIYEYRDPAGRLITYTADQIFHVPGLSMTGLVGMSMIGIAREAIGLGLTLARHGTKLFANGARAGGVLEAPAELSDTAYERLKTSFNEQYSGVENSGKTILLEAGTKFNNLTMPNDDAQFLQTRMFQIEEIARMFRVPPHMIGDLEHATFSNIEQQSLDFVIYSLTPWLVRWEQAISHKLFLPQERARYFSEFLTSALLRGDTMSRYTAYSSAISSGWITRNEVRQIENMNPDNPALDEYLFPLNMAPAGTTPAQPPAGGQ
jgi:HK97 family phage portal protein